MTTQNDLVKNNPHNIANAVHTALVEKYGSTLKRLEFLLQGDKLRAAIGLDLCKTFEQGCERADSAIAHYLPLVHAMVVERYEMELREVAKHNDNAKYDRRMKTKTTLSFEEFKAKHGNIISN